MFYVVNTPFFLYLKSSLWGQIIYSILAGVFGTLLVVLFFSGFMPLGITIKFIPWVVGFNAAVTGYTLMDRTRDKIRHKRAAAGGSGVLVALLTGIILNGLSRYVMGVYLILWPDMTVLMLIGAVLGWAGAALAIRYFNLKS